jgi:hypothetical protein
MPANVCSSTKHIRHWKCPVVTQHQSQSFALGVGNSPAFLPSYPIRKNQSRTGHSNTSVSNALKRIALNEPNSFGPFLSYPNLISPCSCFAPASCFHPRYNSEQPDPSDIKHCRGFNFLASISWRVSSSLPHIPWSGSRVHGSQQYQIFLKRVN